MRIRCIIRSKESPSLASEQHAGLYERKLYLEVTRDRQVEGGNRHRMEEMHAHSVLVYIYVRSS